MKNHRRSISRARYRLAIGIAAAFGASRAMAQMNIVQNAGFEQGSGTTIPDWNSADPNTTIDTTAPHSGLQDLSINNTTPGYAQYVYQSTAAGSVTPGSVYTLSFYASGAFQAGGVGQYELLFFGTNGAPDYYSSVMNFVPGATYSQFPAAGSNTFTAPGNASYAELQFWATTGSTSGSSAQLHLDDVSLTAASTGGGGGSNPTSGVSAWNVSGSGDWNVGSNWTAGNPTGIGAEADMFSAITANATVYTNAAVTLGTLNFNNSNTYVITGAGSLTMQASTGLATIIVQNGTQKIALPLTIASNTVFNVSSGATLHIADQMEILPGESVTTTGSGTVTDTSTIQVDSGASFQIANSINANTLALQANAAASIATWGSRHLLQVDTLTEGANATLDLGNNDLIVHGGNVGTITTELKSGYADGAWNGSGIQSAAAAGDSTHLTALGSMAVTANGTYDGATVSAGDVVVRYTYYGDATLDGTVNSADYAKIDAGYLGELTGWQNGDFNYDGVINGSDYTLIDNAFNQQGAPIGSASAQFATASAQVGAVVAAVPEPATISLLTGGVIGLLSRRCRMVRKIGRCE